MNRALIASMTALLLAPAAALADGLPVVGLDGGSGVVSPDGAYRYITLAGRRSTNLMRVHVRGGAVSRHRTIPGVLAVPSVAYDQSASGLSADGRTLVLIRPRPRLVVPQKRTRLVILDARRLLVKRQVTLPGDFSFDAVSPDGSQIYLVDYLSLTRHNFDPTNYKVRVLDARTGALDPAPVVDPREPGDEMGGFPVTRAMSPDGRWAYTLYSGTDHPFVHALDTVGRTARCVDLDSLTRNSDLFQMKLRVASGGKELQVVNGGRPVLVMDTASFKVRAPAAPARHVGAPASADDGGMPLWPVALAIALLLLIAAVSAKPLARAARAR